MHKLTVACLMAAVLCMVEPAATVSKHAVGVKGTLLCGKTPAKDVHVRLFRVKQGKKDGKFTTTHSISRCASMI